jgi:peroxiredoxin
VGGAFIGTALYLQGQAPIFPAAPAANGLIPTAVPFAGMLQVGDEAPDITFASLDDKPVKLSDFRGKPVMLNFWATWCGPCTAEMKNIEQVYQKHLEEDFVILGVNQGEGASVIEGYAKLWKLNFRLVRDQGDMAARAFQVRALPTTVFVDAEGKVHEIHIGGPVSVEFIEKRVEELLGK